MVPISWPHDAETAKGRDVAIKLLPPALHFGVPSLSEGEKEFYRNLNDAVLRILKTLPPLTQTAALLELAACLNIPFTKDIDFFRGFYPPAWSILYWINAAAAGEKRFSEDDLQNVNAVHASAMLLHRLDDHLVDAQIPLTHQCLLIRSHLWGALNQARGKLTRGIGSQAGFGNRFIERYYSSMDSRKRVDSLNSYCDRFKRQMAMGYIAPVWMAEQITSDPQLPKAVETLFGGFGIAWRLLDDLQDIPADMQTGQQSAVYWCLPEDIKPYWGGSGPDPTVTADRARDIAEFIEGRAIVGQIVMRICRELDSAAMVAAACNIKGYSEELSALAAPLRKMADAG